MKKFILVTAGILLLSGCAADKTAIVDESGIVRMESAGVGISFTDEWSVYVGDEMYSMIFGQYSDSYSDVGEMKKALKTGGMEYIVYALYDGGRAAAVVTVQDITVDSDGEKLDELVTAEDYARSVHDNTIFGYRASGYMTENSRFEEVTLGGKSGWLSEFAVTDNDENGTLLLGFSEFMFEQDNDIYSVQLLYSDEESKHQTDGVVLTAL